MKKAIKLVEDIKENLSEEMTEYRKRERAFYKQLLKDINSGKAKIIEVK